MPGDDGSAYQPMPGTAWPGVEEMGKPPGQKGRIAMADLKKLDLMELEKVAGGAGVSPELREASLELMRYIHSLFTVHNCVGMGPSIWKP